MVIVLAGMLVPAAITHLTRAHLERARRDLDAIRTAVLRHLEDTGVGPTRGFDGTDGQIYRLCGPGVPAQNSYFYPDEHQGWITDHLLSNRPAGIWAEGYAGWRGPYLESIGPDPWGSTYIVVVYPLHLHPERDCIAVSAGPNGRMDAHYEAPFQTVASGDDILVVIRPGER
jgi:hypothetical protein